MPDGTQASGAETELLADEPAARSAALERRLRFLSEASAILASSLDLDATLERFARLAVPTLGDCCLVGVLTPEASLCEVPTPPSGRRGVPLRSAAVAHVSPTREALVRDLLGRAPLARDHPVLAGLLADGPPVLVPQVAPADLERVAPDPELRRLLRALGPRSALAVPLRSHRQTLGLIVCAITESDRRYGPDDLAQVEEVACLAALAVANAQLYEQAQAAIRHQDESLALLDALLACAPVGLAIFDRDCRYLRVNPALETITGLPNAARLGRTVREALPALAPTIEPLIRSVLATGQPVLNQEVTGTVDPARGPRHWLVSYYPVRTADGELLGVGAAILDITERTRSEAAQRFLAEASRELASSLDYETTLANVARLAVPVLADVCVIDVVNPDGTLGRLALTHADPQRERELQPLRHYVPRPGSGHPVLRALETGQTVWVTDFPDTLYVAIAQDEEHLRLLRSLAYCSGLFVPLAARGRILGVIELLMAESRRRHQPSDLALAEELGRRAGLAVDNARLYREAQAAVRLRDEFLSVAAHELKTPITVLHAYGQLLVRQLDRAGAVAPDRLGHALRTIDQQSVRLARLVNHLLEVSRLESGRLALEVAPIDLVALVANAVTLARATTTRHILHFRAPPSLVVRGDPLRLEQVVANLLDNAIKYSPEGGPVEVDLDQTEDGRVRLAVRDHGLGIPPEARARIFDRFYQAHGAQHASGLGLGLYISRQVVLLHGGELRAEFPPEGGTRMVMTLPAS